MLAAVYLLEIESGPKFLSKYSCVFPIPHSNTYSYTIPMVLHFSVLHVNSYSIPVFFLFLYFFSIRCFKGAQSQPYSSKISLLNQDNWCLRPLLFELHALSAGKQIAIRWIPREANKHAGIKQEPLLLITFLS